MDRFSRGASRISFPGRPMPRARSAYFAVMLAWPGVTCLAQEQPALPPVQTQPAGTDADLTVTVKQFRFTGNTVISQRELSNVVETYRGRPLTSEMLEAARVAVTEHYIKKGYINSGAVLPDQDVQSGVVTFQIVEGRLRLNDIHLT